MLKKRSFPDDWSNLTYEQVSENIKYLQENYKRYKVSQSGDGTIHIGNVNISSEYTLQIPYERMICVKINNRQICVNGDKLNVFIDTLKLREMCEHKLKPFKQKAKEWCSYNAILVLTCGIITGLTAITLVATYCTDRKYQKQQQNKFEQKIQNNQIDTIHYSNQNQR